MIRDARRVLAFAAGVILCLGCGLSKTPTPPEASPIRVEAALRERLLEAGSARSLVARIGVTALARNATKRPPVNLALLIDTSSSMEGRPIEDARKASLALLDSLRPEDQLAVMVFHSTSEVLLPATTLRDADLKDIRSKIGRLEARGTTDMASGLRLALDSVAQSFRADGVNRIVLLGDGVPNDAGPIAPCVADAASRGISITALGLGNDYDESLMGRIAQQSGGRFFYVDDSAKVASFFAEEVVRIERVVARSAVLELRPGPGVSVDGVVGRSSSPIDRGVAVALGDLSLGEEQEIIVDLVASGAKDGANVEVLDAVLRFQDGASGTTREERVFVGARAETDRAAIDASRDPAVEKAVIRAREAAATLEEIERQRASDRPTELMPPKPAPLAMPPESAESVRRTHDRAMRHFQAH
jgi:Ca-activated chloride channel homolog